MKKIKDVLRLRIKGELSFPKIALATGVPKSTVSDYCRKFEVCGKDIDTVLGLNDDALYTLLFPNKPSIVSSKRQRALPDYEAIRREFAKKEVTLELLWEEYKRIHPGGYALTQFKFYYRRYVQTLNPSMRQTYAPGETMFVDYSGSTLNVHNTLDGTTSKAQIFVAVLGASGMTFVHATASQKQEDFILSHLKAFSFYGGVAHFTTPDNLKSAVISHKKGVVVLNESYEEMARHFDTVIQPARPYKPKDKAKAEQGVLGIQRWILAQLRHQTFFSVDEINQAIAPLLDRYNAKVIKRLGKSRIELFETIEKIHLKPLPSNRYVYREFKSAIVDLGYHVQLHKCFYSVPYTHLKAKVEIAYSATTVWVLLHSEVIATHPRIFRAGEYATQENHMPPQHLYSQQAMHPQRLLKWAREIGGYAEIFVEHRLVSVEYPPNAYKSLIAILKLAKQYGNNELNAALQYASLRNIHSYRSIESILAKKLYVTLEATSTDAQITYSPAAHRGSSYYC
jgi:transposase